MLGATQCPGGGERNETHKRRAALLSDARSLATGRFSRKHYFEESSKFWRSGRNALRINDYLADHRPENTLLEFDQLAARSFHNFCEGFKRSTRWGKIMRIRWVVNENVSLF
jgi:hypothetical protein